MRSQRFQRGLLKVGLLTASLGFVLLLAEGVTRFVQPLHMTQRVSLEGEPIPHWLVPGATYRQISSEYDAPTTITESGHRAPAPEGNPEVIFLGDSFTFGWGLGNEQTFASIYCRETGRSCANLGKPGTGTTVQVQRLRHFLDEMGWRPVEIKLFIFAMSAGFSAGNDLAGNYNLAESRGPVGRASEEGIDSEVGPGLLERIFAWRSVLLEHSNLIRVVKFHWGPLLKTVLVPGVDETRLFNALELTREALEQLDDMSQEYVFSYSLYLLHPLQAIRRGDHTQTLEDLNAIAPAPIRSTAHVLSDNTEDYFFTLDGHLNREGALRIAGFLLAEQASLDRTQQALGQ